LLALRESTPHAPGHCDQPRGAEHQPRTEPEQPPERCAIGQITLGVMRLEHRPEVHELGQARALAGCGRLVRGRDLRRLDGHLAERKRGHAVAGARRIVERQPQTAEIDRARLRHAHDVTEHARSADDRVLDGGVVAHGRLQPLHPRLLRQLERPRQPALALDPRRHGDRTSAGDTARLDLGAQLKIADVPGIARWAPVRWWIGDIDDDWLRAAPQTIAAANAVATTEKPELERAHLESPGTQRKEGDLPDLDGDPTLAFTAVLVDGLTAAVLHEALGEKVGMARLARAGRLLKQPLRAMRVDRECHLLPDDGAPSVDVGIEKREWVGRALRHEIVRSRRQLIEARVAPAQPIKKIVEAPIGTEWIERIEWIERRSTRTRAGARLLPGRQHRELHGLRTLALPFPEHARRP
jgi:hypothetical protein